MFSPAPRHSDGPTVFPLRRTALAWMALLLGSARAVLPAQTPGAGCMLNRQVYTCDWQVFRARFAAVHTVAIETPPRERAAGNRLRELAEALGKSVAGPEQPADAVFRVVSANPSGIAIGPADQPLATLQVLAPAAAGNGGGSGTLLWAETFVGQADRPWPTVVAAVADQFQARFGPHHR